MTRTEVDSDDESVGKKSVYYVDGEDEWSSLIKYDSDLYKRDLMLKKVREEEFKKKIKMELDQQLREKKDKIDRDRREQD